MQFQLAQINIAKMLAPLDNPVMKDFVDNLDRINSLAESSDGFIWRLKDDSENATAVRIFDDDFLIVNMSVWKDIDSLHRFAYKSDHVEIFKRKKEWFEKMQEMHMAMWYIPKGHRPTVGEAEERLIHIRQYGDTQHAFSFKKRFMP